MSNVKTIYDTNARKAFETIVLPAVDIFFQAVGQVYSCKVKVNTMKLLKRSTMQVGESGDAKLVSFVDANTLEKMKENAESYGFVSEQSEKKNEAVFVITLYDTDETSDAIKNADFRKKLMAELTEKDVDDTAYISPEAEKFVVTFMIPKFKEMIMNMPVHLDYFVQLNIKENMYVSSMNSTYEVLPQDISQIIDQITARLKRENIILDDEFDGDYRYTFNVTKVHGQLKAACKAKAVETIKGKIQRKEKN